MHARCNLTLAFTHQGGWTKAAAGIWEYFLLGNKCRTQVTATTTATIAVFIMFYKTPCSTALAGRLFTIAGAQGGEGTIGTFGGAFHRNKPPKVTVNKMTIPWWRRLGKKRIIILLLVEDDYFFISMDLGIYPPLADFNGRICFYELTNESRGYSCSLRFAFPGQNA